jgi:type IV secretory pathway VirB2 component (pilin)
MKFKTVRGLVAELARNVRGRVTRNARNGWGFAKRKFSWTSLYGALIVSCYAGAAVAQTSTSTSVSDTSAPWDSSLCGVAGWFKGSGPIAVATIAFAAAGLGFLFGEELTGMLKKLVNIVMAVSVVIGGAAIVGYIATKLGATASTCTSTS